MRKVYITTPLYYVNSLPHIGHAYTNIAADVLARFYRLTGCEVYFLTGTDEHGQKIKKAAEEKGLEVKDFVDKIVGNFLELWGRLNVEYDDFIRTTEERHIRLVKKAIISLYEKGDIYESIYEGFYCTPCESFWSESQLDKGRCPDCLRTAEFIREKNYFFKLSRYQDWLLDYLKATPSFIKPSIRYNEVISFLENNALNDLCISRPKERIRWGIDFPLDKDYVVYVWFDALLNYISAAGCIFEEEKFSQLWPADVHFIGKDILRQHAIYWPIMLKALGLEIPKLIFAHGWWLIEKEDSLSKMSKSKGNIISPYQLIEEFGVDALRFFLLREVPFGLDGKFSYRAIIQRINSDLANDLGNLVFRSLTMVEKYTGGETPPQKYQAFSQLRKILSNLKVRYIECMQEVNFYEALRQIWKLVTLANRLVEEKKPWLMKRENKIEELREFLYNLLEAIRIISVYLYPFMPQASSSIYFQLGLDRNLKEVFLEEEVEWAKLPSSLKLRKAQPLFPRQDVD